MEIIKNIEREQIRMDLPNFAPGDTVTVHVKIREGNKERLQAFQGVVISKKKGLAQCHLHRAQSLLRRRGGKGFSHEFTHHRPRRSRHPRKRVRRAKIYYLRKLRGKAARIREKRFT